MIEPPKTRAEAEKHFYGRLYKQGFDPQRCAYEVWPKERAPNPHQCLRNPGFGPDRLYCKQHDPDAQAKRRQEGQAEYERKLRLSLAPHEAMQRLRAIVGSTGALQRNRIDAAHEWLEQLNKGAK